LKFACMPTNSYSTITFSTPNAFNTELDVFFCKFYVNVNYKGIVVPQAFPAFAFMPTNSYSTLHYILNT
jgi:hypothetical protein